MRRPLFGNGIPVPVGLVPVLVFDTKAVDPPGEQHSYALTLFFWDTPTDASVGFKAYVVTAGAPATYMAVTAANLAKKRLTEFGTALVIDRLVLRGDQQVYVQTTTGGAGHVYGYFEMDGTQDEPLRYRPLQPSNNLVAPFNATPAVLLLGPSATGTTDVHALDPDYLDLLELTIASATDQEILTGPPFATVILPGGIQLPYLSKTSNQYLNDVVFPGIPMRAPSAADKMIKLFLSSDTAVVVPPSSTGATAFGFFDRH